MVELGAPEAGEEPVEEVSAGPRRRNYRATAYRRAVARAETARLKWLVEVAARGGVVT